MFTFAISLIWCSHSLLLKHMSVHTLLLAWHRGAADVRVISMLYSKHFECAKIVSFWLLTLHSSFHSIMYAYIVRIFRHWAWSVLYVLINSTCNVQTVTTVRSLKLCRVHFCSCTARMFESFSCFIVSVCKCCVHASLFNPAHGCHVSVNVDVVDDNISNTVVEILHAG